MANHCITHVYVSGPSGELAELRALYPFDFEEIIPMPADVEAAAIAEEDQLRAQYLQEHGRGDFRPMSPIRYDWNIEHWGCKWPPYTTGRVFDEQTRFGFYMETAWSPPFGVLKAISERLPTLELAVVGHDYEGPCASAWRYVAGAAFDHEKWQPSERVESGAIEYHDDCNEWVEARLREFEARREDPAA